MLPYKLAKGLCSYIINQGLFLLTTVTGSSNFGFIKKKKGGGNL